MSGQWWERPYKGGPMVVPQAMFPRPLYPPDAAAKGKTPSVNGPDVEAYKRGLWRGGRWPGPASGFDRAYSNGFAHGRGPNVIDSGVAGFQRQMKIDATGWFGQKTFNTLASALVPEGRPNAGQPLLDANAQNLIAQAFQMFGGKEPAPEPPPSPTTTTRERAFNAAVGYLGYKESPANSNRTQFGKWYGVDGQPWCAIFCTYCFVVDAGGSPSFLRGQNYAYVPYIVSDARNGRNGLTVTGTPVKGDLVCYDWAYDGTYDHVGIFEAFTGGASFTAVEGNTSVGNDSNGGSVMRRTRNANQQATTFVRVREPT